MKNVAGVFVLSIGLVMDYACAQQFSMRYDFEAEEGRSTGRRQNNVVYLELDEHVTSKFRINSSCSVSVANVFYYSGGSSSGSVVVKLDEMIVDSFVIQPPEVDDSPANLWKIRYQSGRVGTSMLPPGSHSLTLTAKYIGCRGVEIDKTTLSFICEEDPNEEGGTPQTDDAGGTPQTDDAGGTPHTDSISTLESGPYVHQIVTISLSIPATIVAIGSIIGGVLGCIKCMKKKNSSSHIEDNKPSTEGRI